MFGTDIALRFVRVTRSANSVIAYVDTSQAETPRLVVKLMCPDAVQGHLGPDAASLPSISRVYQEAFRAFAPKQVVVPRVLYSDDEMGVLVTEYFNGQALKRILSLGKVPESLHLRHILELAARALSCWHATSAVRLPNRSTQRGLPTYSVVSFLDFSVWNILVSPDFQSICLLDFPGCTTLMPRHRDLATYLHSLLVVQHHPLMKIRRAPWWNWRETYGYFLHAYAAETDTPLSQGDLELIRRSLQEIVAREIANYQRIRMNPRMRVEGAWYSRLQNHRALHKGTLDLLFDKDIIPIGHDYDSLGGQ